MTQDLAYTPTWHALEEAAERAWLDQWAWARLHTIPTPGQSEPATTVPMPAYATTGS